MKLVLPDDRDRRKRDDDVDDRQAEGQHGGHNSAEEQQQNDQRHRDAEPLTLLQVVPRQLVVLEGYAGVSADEYAKIVRLVHLVDRYTYTLT